MLRCEQLSSDHGMRGRVECHLIFLIIIIVYLILQFEGLLTEPDSPENCGSDTDLHLNGRVTF